MPEIVLTEEQVRVLTSATTAVLIRHPSGAAVGVIDPREADIIEEAKRRLREEPQGLPAEKVQLMLAALQAEWDRTGGFDQDHMHAFLTKFRAESQDG